MTKILRGKRKPKEHEGDIEALIEFVGYELLSQVERICRVTRQREMLEIAGEIMEGTFTLRVTFNGETKH